jgi:hypothetical protein
MIAILDTTKNQSKKRLMLPSKFSHKDIKNIDAAAQVLDYFYNLG